MSQQLITFLICFMNKMNITLLTLDLHIFRQFWHASTNTLIIVSFTMCCFMHIHTFMQDLIFMYNKWLPRSSVTKENQSYHITPHYYLIMHIGAYKFSPKILNKHYLSRLYIYIPKFQMIISKSLFFES